MGSFRAITWTAKRAEASRRSARRAMVGAALFSGAFGELPSGERRTGSAGRVARGAAADDLAVVGANTLRSSGRWCSVTRMRTSAVGCACVTATGTSWGPGTSEPDGSESGTSARLCVAASDRVEAEPPVPSLLRPSAPIKHEDRTVQRSIRGILDAVLIDIDDDPASNRTEWHESKRNALGITTAQL